MKTKIVIRLTLIFSLFIIVLSSCSKSDSGSSNDLSSLNGTWQTTVWGGANDTARATLSSSSATGTLIYLSTGAKNDSKFSTGDVIFSDIQSTGNETYSCSGTFRYTATAGTNETVGTTQAVITLQNSNTTMYVHYSKDATSGITPPDYYCINNSILV